ncbi:MFS transporter [Tardiphaga sp.]|uniref:MFS transporter n=1 Tax=Tardiphaga sp. TaxID=1926292 RepID=UPI0025CEFE04|nr:MFS transporter [Tardiphaga sp.]
MTSPPEFQPKRLMTRRLSIIFQIAALGTVAMCASAPTPLYRVYQQHWEFSPVMVTIVFSAYAISLLLALLTVGGLSDYIGRRPMIFSGLAISALALVMFIAADSVAMLIAARTVQGFAVGIAFGAIGAAMLDTDRAHGSLMNSVTPVTGTAIGTLFSGLLLTYAPMPTQLIYVVLLIASVLLAALVWWMPETGVKRPGALASLRPVVRVPHHARPALILVSPGIVALWALCGFYLSLMPGLLQLETGSNSPLLGGFAVSLLTFSGAAAMLLARPWPGITILIRSMSALIVGVFITLAGTSTQSIPLLLTGTVVAGFGFGAGFFGSVRLVVPLAQPHERAGLLSVILIVGYLAFSLPTIVAGLFVPRLGLPLTLYIYGAAVIVLAAISLIAAALSVRRAA